MRVCWEIMHVGWVRLAGINDEAYIFLVCMIAAHTIKTRSFNLSLYLKKGFAKHDMREEMSRCHDQIMRST
jgi:hypothetical protein